MTAEATLAPTRVTTNAIRSGRYRVCLNGHYIGQVWRTGSRDWTAYNEDEGLNPVGIGGYGRRTMREAVEQLVNVPRSFLQDPDPRLTEQESRP